MSIVAHFSDIFYKSNYGEFLCQRCHLEIGIGQREIEEIPWNEGKCSETTESEVDIL